MEEDNVQPQPVSALTAFFKSRGEWFRTHLDEVLGGTLAVAVATAAWNFGVGVWQWLVNNVSSHPAGFLSTVSLGVATLAVWKMFLYRRIGVLASQEAAKAERLERELCDQKQHCKNLEKLVQKKDDPLDERDLLVLACILKQEGSFDAIMARVHAGHMGWNVSVQATIMAKLEHSLQFIDTHRNSGSPTYFITGKGYKYATAKGLSDVLSKA